MLIRVAWQRIKNEIDAARGERAILQDKLSTARPADKPAIIRKIKALNEQIAAQQTQLDAVLPPKPAEPEPLEPIEAMFVGVSELTTTSTDAPGPYFKKFDFLRLRITGDVVSGYTTISIVLFPEIQLGFNTALGWATTKVNLIGGGTGSYAAGAITLPMTLRFATTIDLPDPAGSIDDNSNLSLTLSTDPPEGSPVTPEPFGKVNLAGSGDFVGGRLGGSRGKLRLGELTNCRMVGEVMECEWGKGEIRKWEPVPVPYCITLFWHEARDQVLAAGLVPDFYGPNFATYAWVKRQSPFGGSLVPPGTTVSMEVTDEEQP
jgi:hypothetical protein